MAFLLQIHPADSAAVTLQNLRQGEYIQLNGFDLLWPLSIEQKLPLKRIAVGETILMYGVPVGKVRTDLHRGEQHEKQHTQQAAAPYTISQKQAYNWQQPATTCFQNRSFNGYAKTNGRADTRNYWLVVPLEKIIQTANGELIHAEVLQQGDFIRWRKSLSV